MSKSDSIKLTLLPQDNPTAGDSSNKALLQHRCLMCNKEIMVRPSDAARNKGIYCSSSCRAKNHAGKLNAARLKQIQKERHVEKQPEDHKIIMIKGGKLALVSNEDYERLMCFAWSIFTGGYAACKAGSMHRMVMNAKPGQMIDHINRNKLDNRRSNLRFIHRQGNSFNTVSRVDGLTSKYKGVCKRLSLTSPWLAQITYCGENIYLGCYETEIEAAIAYDIAAIQLVEEWAYLNVL